MQAFRGIGNPYHYCPQKEMHLCEAGRLPGSSGSLSLAPRQFEEMVAAGATIIDARDSAAFGGFHIPGSINIGFEKQLANWVGIVVDPKGLRKNNFTELAPGFRCSLKMGCENVKLFLRKP